MAGPQNYIDNLENLRLVMSVALEHTQKNRDQFLKNSTGEQVRQAERLISKGPKPCGAVRERVRRPGIVNH
jgi:hypothetical protein